MTTEESAETDNKNATENSIKQVDYKELWSRAGRDSEQGSALERAIEPTP